MPDERDTLISRQVALKAAVEVYIAIGGDPLDAAAKVEHYAAAFEAWILRPSAPNQVSNQRGPTQEPVPFEAGPPEQWTPSPEHVENLDFTKCPQHYKGIPSKFPLRPDQFESLFCPERGCGWTKITWINTYDDGRTEHVAKYGWGGKKGLRENEYVDALLAERLVSA